ncbi:MAG: hypothetical protein Q4C67_10085, partial [Deinococcus sp.]|nr:hypothetical protein [Deinococcus sp.]
TQGEAATPVLRPGGGWAGLWVSVRQDALGLALLAVLALHPEAGNFWLVLALTAPILTALRWRLLAVPLTHTQAAWCDGLLRPFTLWALAALLSSVAAFAALPPALVPTTFAGESGQPDWGRMLVVGLPLYLEWSRRRQLLAAARKRDATGTPRLGD